jgi:hypothetical protein
MSGWLFEGIACYVSRTSFGHHIPLYRAWNGSDHFYTTSINEYNGLPSQYAREGIACYVAASQMQDHSPLYRYYHTTKDDHIYTASTGEKQNLDQDSVWRYEGVQCFVRQGPGDNHVPFYRLYNSEIVDHFYTTSLNEVETASDLLFPDGTSEYDVLVRTLNTYGQGVGNPLRLRGIAREFHSDLKSQIGLIGLQEARNDMWGCRAGSSLSNAAYCLAAELSILFGPRVEGRHTLGGSEVEVGIVAGDDWRVISSDHWGIHTGFLGFGTRHRKMLEVLLEHRVEGFRVRFYSVHFTPGDDEKSERRHQAKRVTGIVRERARTGELPPIVVGDFNAQRNFVTGDTEASVRQLEKNFWRPIDTLNLNSVAIPSTGIDIIYIGKKSRFSGSAGRFRPVKHRPIQMNDKEVVVEGVVIPELSDHDAEGFTLKIENGLPWEQARSEGSRILEAFIELLRRLGIPIDPYDG